jgi:hypothetical protein
MANSLPAEFACPAHNPVNAMALVQQELGKTRPILVGYASYEGGFSHLYHVSRESTNQPVATDTQSPILA